ncbi:tRNA (guanosine(37)-N1)-methyltransferase TrmD [Rubinisphaera sp. JC750]|uniref:tRNA (guanosine(37)-N1)-methyltransferase TrmD n=1 Tax=Rubinisphaera sp. JC750 TaxID=2898658 RepID=UPI001F011F6F|nr:tRNA (guanosine(37)-N1)-methyltransferase TrmD [Rubinisphaera sp. JC750]
MRFDILTLFPGIFDGFLSESLLRKGIDKGLLDVHLWNFREWTTDRHQSVDDRPYGGGPGMLIRCDPVYQCLEHVQQQGEQPGQLIMLTPYGKRLNQQIVEELAEQPRLTLLCGRYEGFDERISQGLKPLELSVGDFVCNGGEIPAMIVVETVMRLIPGMLGDEDSARYDSHSQAGQLEYPQYTRPREYRGMTVPDVLLSGDHQKIADWRQTQSEQRSRQRVGDDSTSGN